LVQEVITALQRENFVFDVLARGSTDESSVIEWMENAFPIQPWGRVNWSGVKHARCRSSKTWEEMRQAYEALLDQVEAERREPSAPILLVWSNAARPVLRVPFAALRACGAEILDADFDVWLICPTEGWCIEKYHEGELCYGR